MHDLNRVYIDIIVSQALTFNQFLQSPTHHLLVAYVKRPHSVVSFPQRVVFSPNGVGIEQRFSSEYM